MFLHNLSIIFTNYKYFLIWLLPFLYYAAKLIYRYVRRKFPIQVNCWFCNENSIVDYDNWNSFTCSSCKQYNGFTKEGDYNKPIPEQQDELLNHIISPRNYRPAKATNGLCILCNNNQQLKIYQLRNFVPLNEEDYDIEIVHFQKQLEKAYKLCPQCNLTVRKTIAKQNSSLIGKQIEEIRKSGKTLLNQSTTAKISLIRIRRFVLLLIPFITIVHCYPLLYGNIYEFWGNLLTFLQKYSREFIFTIGGSFFTWVSMNLMKTETAIPKPLLNKIKQEKLPKPQKSTESQEYGGDISYSSFNSPLNSTIRSDDEQTFYSELELLSANSSPSVHSIRASSINSQPNNVFNISQNRLNTTKTSPLPSRSLSPNSTFYSLHSTRGPFSTKTNVDLTLDQLRLSNNNQNDLKRPILSPAKFRNPWTGKLWECDAPSRSSSQSSGIYSRAASICGDEVASITSDNLFHSVPSRLETCSLNSMSMKSPLNQSFHMHYA